MAYFGFPAAISSTCFPSAFFSSAFFSFGFLPSFAFFLLNNVVCLPAFVFFVSEAVDKIKIPGLTHKHQTYRRPYPPHCQYNSQSLSPSLERIASVRTWFFGGIFGQHLFLTFNAFKETSATTRCWFFFVQFKWISSLWSVLTIHFLVALFFRQRSKTWSGFFVRSVWSVFY